MAKILFINPVVREEDVPRHVPYGIALLSAICIEKGHLVQVYDENAWRKGSKVLGQVFQADDWDVIGLGGITTAYSSIKSIVKQARENCPNSTIVLGGGILTSLPREMMVNFDYKRIREYEKYWSKAHRSDATEACLPASGAPLLVND